MARVLEGLRVLDVSSGVAGPLTAMLLADRGATVVKVEPPGGDPMRSTSGQLVADRGKRSTVLDLADPADRERFLALADAADVLVESFAPGVTTRLGIDYAALAARNEGLVYCSITGYGTKGSWAARPGWDALVQARSGIQGEQPPLFREGPAFLHTPLPSYGACFLAASGLHAALHVRERTGRGQLVETSLMQGAFLWTTMIWTHGERPTPDLLTIFRYKDIGPTPTYGSADAWFHPMPQGPMVAAAHIAWTDPDLDFRLTQGDHEQRMRREAAIQRLYDQRSAAEWLELLQASDVSAQLCLPPGEAFEHPQVINNRVVAAVDVAGVGPTRQLGYAYHLERDAEPTPSGPPRLGDHNGASWPDVPRPVPAGGEGAPAYALEGVRVLDYGVALAGPFGPMTLAELGADVIKIDNITPAVGTANSIVWAACQRGKRSIAIDLKSPKGQEISRRLIASADVLHYNMRTGVAERLGFGYEQAKVVNPGIIFCHTTGYGNTGPLATWPGVDQMGQAMSGIEWEQGATFDGGHPQWSRFGFCDAATGLLSIIGVLQALYHRDRTGEGQFVESNILNAGMFCSSDVVEGPDGVLERPHLDRLQTGFGPCYRLYETARGWLCVVAVTEEHWRALCATLGRPELAADARFSDAPARAAHAGELGGLLEAVFRSKDASDWFSALDGAGVPCEVAYESPSDERSSGGSVPPWFEDPEAIANGWVVTFDHPVWGRLVQPGRFFEFSETPGRHAGPPALVGQHTREIMLDLGYHDAEIDALRADGVVAW